MVCEEVKMKAQILKMLREADGYISGQQLCEKFGVSRTAVYDYIIDAMNTVESKLLLIENAKISKTPIISVFLVP